MIEATTSESNIPIIQTVRLKLRPFHLNDAKEVQRLAGNIIVAEMTATIPHPYPDGAAEEWISKHGDLFQNGDAFNWAIEICESRRLIGCISFGVNKKHKKAEMGYWIGEEFWGMGYCTEAAIASIEFIFKNFDLNKITARHKHYNPASGKVMEKAGMEKDGYLKQEFLKSGNFADMIVYGLLRENWRNNVARRIHANT